MNQIYVMLNHQLTPDQRAELEDFELVRTSEFVKKWLLNSPDCQEGIDALISKISLETRGIEHILCPGGSPAFNALFSSWALYMGKTLWFSHSVREFTETVREDGSVEKVNVFRHVKFIKIFTGDQI